MISVPYTFQKTFHYEINQGKNVGGQWGTDSTVYRKYPSLAKNQDGECSLMQQLTHPAHPKRLISPSYLCFGGKAEKYEIRAE